MDELADLAALKVLANPLRQRILHILSRVGEATSTTLAKELGVTTGGTSYNLRVLAEHGFIEEVPDPPNRRERWWRPGHRGLRFPRQSEQSEEMQTLLDGLNEQWLGEDLAAFAAFQRARPELGEWADALPYSRGSLDLGLDQLAQFFEDYLALLYRYRERPTEPGARRVLLRFVAFPEVTDDG
ncbi:winged helix-turn-helix domain-containing protein [Microlunatus speluncae]|uniref:winged helix-turn-helix domain-containing protein n=1 Tax=Microlunatus speluncae TaxID=2594267 RepID=UPI00126672E3|nr:helix-turn-helix domain-containing protein [Microlunatus speluncae]